MVKIKRFDLIKEDSSTYKDYYLIVEQDNFDVYYLFEKKEDACKFTLKKLYEYFKENSGVLQDLDTLTNNMDFDEISEFYIEVQARFYNINKLIFQELEIKDEVKLPNWVEARLSAKKYNL